MTLQYCTLGCWLVSLWHYLSKKVKGQLLVFFFAL